MWPWYGVVTNIDLVFFLMDKELIEITIDNPACYDHDWECGIFGTIAYQISVKSLGIRQSV